MPVPDPPPYPENLLSPKARERIERAWDEYDLIRKRALSALDTRYRAEPGGCADFMEYLGNGQAGIDFAESRIKAASAVLRVEAEEYGKLRLPGREFREIMEGKIDETAYSLEFSTLQSDALKAEFMRPAHQEPDEKPGSVGSSTEPVPAKDRVKAYMEKNHLDNSAFAKKINASVRTVGSVLAGVRVGKQTRIAVAKELRTTPDDLFPD